MTEIVKNNSVVPSYPIYEVIEAFVSLKNSKHTQRAYKMDLEGLFNSLNMVMLEDLAELQLNELINKIQAYIEKIKKVEVLEDRKRVINSKTINRKLNSFRSFFNYLVQVFNYPKNPLDNFQNLKVDTFSNTKSLTRGEIVDLLSLAKWEHRTSELKFRNYLILLFLFGLALRREEVASLKWDDIDLNRQTANLYQKGGKYKLLPVPATLCILLLEFKWLYSDKTPYVFHPVRNNSHKTTEKPLSTSYIFELVKKLAFKVVPEKNITPHSLRKTFIELALNNGDDLISICNATGHSTIEMIKYYDTRDSLKNNSIHSLSKLL